MPSVETRPLAGGGTRYVVRVRDPDRGKYSSATFAFEDEARQFVRDVDDRGVPWALAEYRRAKDAGDEMTLNDWAARHFASIPNITAGTLITYQRIYARTWQDPLGHYRLSQLDRELIAKTVQNVPGSDKTVKNAWGVLASMLKMAVVDGHLVRSPALGIKLAKRTGHEKVEHRYLTEAEFWQVLDDTPAYWRPLVVLLGGTGMRWGEAAALLVSDVDLVNRTVRVTKAEKWNVSTSAREIGPPKTAKGRRTITLPNEVIDGLEPVLTGRKRGERLFLPPKGGPLRHMTFYRDIWRRKSTANLHDPKPRLHDLRHSHVAWLIAAGAPLPVIQARLGHEKITTTIDTYGHLMPDVQRAAADAAGMVFSRRPPRELT